LLNDCKRESSNRDKDESHGYSVISQGGTDMTKKTANRICVFFVVLAVLASCGMAFAKDDYPNKTIEFGVGWVPGGNSDTLARVLAPKISEVLGQPVIVVNKPGAMGTLVMALLAKSPPDGYKIVTCPNSSLTSAPHFEKVEFDIANDFTYLAKLYDITVMLGVPADSPFKTIQELMTYAKSDQRKLILATWGNFSGAHLATEEMSTYTGAKWEHVPYKGEAAVVTALLGKHADFGSLTENSLPHIKAGTLRPLLILSQKRLAALPDVPCLKDIGLTFSVAGMTEAYEGIMAPKGLPKDVHDKLLNAIKIAWDSKEFKEACEKTNFQRTFVTGEDYRQLVIAGNKAVGEVLAKYKK
jgi:tripartite-type tricarboxylate transporter receptor subunit TctC